MQTLPVAGDMPRGMIGKAEVGEEKAFRVERRNGVQRSVPEFEVDVRWRRRGEDEGVPFDSDARGIPDKSNSLQVIEISDVMRSVPGSIKNPKLARAKRKRFAAL